MTALSRFHPLFVTGLCAFFAVALQIQHSLFQAENYEGLRVNLADFALPVAGLFVLTSILLKKTQWPRFEKPFGYGWIAALTAMMVFALWNGDGGQWALVNKFAGWFVLMAYLGAGAWTGFNFQSKANIFLKIFTATLLISATALPVVALADNLGLVKIELYLNRPYKASMGNPNAYGFLFCSAGAFITLPALKNKSRSLPLLVFWALAPCLAAFSGSRTLWIVLSLLLAAITVIDWKTSLRRIIPALIVGLLLTIPLMQERQREYMALRPFLTMKWLHEYATAPEQTDAIYNITQTGDNRRLANIKLAADLWRENPIMGAGLGASHEAQVERHGKLLAVIDNTLLWIAAEMGSVGVLIFLGAYIAMICALWRKSKYDGLARNAMALLLIFGIYSLFHEVLYTRFLWFILGLALVNTRPAE